MPLTETSPKRAKNNERRTGWWAGVALAISGIRRSTVRR